MKTLVLIAGAFFMLSSLQAQDNKNYWSQDKVNDFVLDAQSKNLLLAALAKVGKEKATSQAVKDLARMEEQEHMKTKNTLERSVTVAIPVTMNPDDVKEVDRIKQKSGDDLDKELVDAFVKYHEKAINAFDDAKDHLQEASLRKWVTDQLPMEKEHLERAKDLKNRID